jgi:hypothetical protein
VNELKVNDANLTSPGEITEAFNTYVSNVGPILANSMPDSSVSFEQFVKPNQSKMLRFKLVPYRKVLNLLNSLSKSKATGLNKISGKILKAAASSIASSLTYIFNPALISSHFPSERKVARLLPLQKWPRNLPTYLLAGAENCCLNEGSKLTSEYTFKSECIICLVLCARFNRVY